MRVEVDCDDVGDMSSQGQWVQVDNAECGFGWKHRDGLIDGRQLPLDIGWAERNSNMTTRSTGQFEASQYIRRSSGHQSKAKSKKK